MLTLLVLQGPLNDTGCNMNDFPLGMRSVGAPWVAAHISFHAFTKALESSIRMVSDSIWKPNNKYLKLNYIK